MHGRSILLWLGVAIAGVLGVGIGASITEEDAAPSAPPTATSPSTEASTTTSTASPEQPRAAFATCSSDQLDAGIGGHDGATGTVIWTIVVVNRGDPCSVHGWPHLTLLDRDGRELPIGAQQLLVRDPGPVDLFGTDAPFRLHDAPLVEAAQVQIHTATDRGDVPVEVYPVDQIVLRLPGVPGSLAVATDGMVLSDPILVYPLFGPRGTIRD